MKKTFYGWWVTAACFITFGISVGLPYYNIPFFTDYYQKNFGWTRSEITLGFPIAALLTLWVGPVLVPRLSPRKSIVIGTGLTLLTFIGWSQMSGSLAVYYLFWFFYTMGYILSGPIPHQVMVSHWFRRNRGRAMGMMYVGVGVLASLGSILVQKITPGMGFRGSLMVIGLLMLVAWPIAMLVLRDKPADKGQYPDGDLEPPPQVNLQPRSFGYLLSNFPFWLLLIASFCSIGSIGAVNFHMKFVFDDQFKAAGFTNYQSLIDVMWRNSSVIILWSSVIGRLIIGDLADRFSMKYVMFCTYFVVAATVPVLLLVQPPGTPWAFSILFGFAMGADYMLIPLMAARQFGVNTLARAMAVILPVNTIGQTWFPYLIARLREYSADYTVPLYTVFGLAMIGAVAVAMMPKRGAEDETLHVQEPGGAAASR